MADYLYPRIMYARGINRVKRFFLCTVLRVHDPSYSFTIVDADWTWGVDLGYSCDLCDKNLFL